MAAKKETVVADEAKVVTEAEPKYDVEVLRDKSTQLFGISSSTFDGAMFGHEEKEYSVSEAKALIEEWLRGKVGK